MNSARKFLSLLRYQETLLFLFLWFVYGLLINSNNLESFNLQQIGIEAIVERGRFYLEGSTSSLLQPGVDTFSYRGHIYAAKQPGQFMAGAIVYYVLHYCFGLDYRNHYLLSSGLVTFFTTSLATALASLFVFRFAKILSGTRSLFWPMLATLTFALATIALAYSGIAHHDALAADYLIIACYCLFRLSRERFSFGGEIARAGVAGVLLGFTITTSALPALMVFVAVVWFIAFRRWTLSLILLTGCIIGTIPLLIYDAVCFGNPFLPPFLVPNWTGPFPYPHFRLSWPNLKENTQFYTEFVTQYVPTFWLGMIGLLYFLEKHRRESILFLGVLAVLGIYLLGLVGNKGGCMYGPRYLLPAMPFASIGLIGLSHVRKRWLNRVTYFVAIICLYSAFVNLIGAMQGAMYCDVSRFALQPYLSAIVAGRVPSYPLFAWLIGPAILVFFLVLSQRLFSQFSK